MWFQYVIGYDKQEQRSLAVSWQNRLFDLRRSAVTKFDQARKGFPAMVRPLLLVLIAFAAVVALVMFSKRVRSLGWRGSLRIRHGGLYEGPRVDFYERLIRLLEKQGLKREPYETPLEFAQALDISEALAITNAYNRVRFGEEKLSESERRQIENLLSRIESGRRNN